MFPIFKKSAEENIEKIDFEPILTNLIDLLYQNSNIEQAEWVEEIKSALLTNDLDSFKNKLISVDMWGGSGAVWEVGGFKSESDHRKLISELIKLTDLMKKSGLKSKAAQSRGNLLKRIKA